MYHRHQRGFSPHSIGHRSKRIITHSETVHGKQHFRITYSSLLEWGQQKFRRVVKYNQANVASFMSAPESKEYRVFKKIFDATDEGIEETTLAFNTTVVTNDEED